MASGTIAFEKSNPTGSYLEGKIEWTSVANKDANTSDLTLQIYVRKRATNQQLTIPTTGAWIYEFTVNGQAVEGKSGGNTSVLQTFVLIGTETVTVAHNADGTKNVSIVGFVQGPSISDGYKDKQSKCDAVAKMDTIPRASQITSAANTTLRNKCNVKWTPASAAFRYRLEFKLGDFAGQTALIHPNTTAAYTYTGYSIPLSVANQIPKSKTDTMTVTLTTYSDSAGTQAIGSYSKTFTVTVPDDDSTKPSVEAALTPVSNLAGEYQNLYIQGYSKVKADVAAGGKYGATTNTPVLSINGVAQKSLTSGYLTSSGENTVSVSVADSRGITRTVSRTVSVIPYVKPSLKSYGIGRSADGQFNDSGTDLRIDASWDYSPVEQMNSCKLQYQLRAAGVAFDNNWTDVTSEGKSTSVIVENGLVEAEKSYHVKIRVIDEIGNTAEATSDIPTDKVYWHRDGKRGSLTFGGYVEEDDAFAIAPGKKFKAQGPVELGEGEGGAKSFTIGEDGSTQFHVPVKTEKNVDIRPTTETSFAGLRTFRKKSAEDAFSYMAQFGIATTPGACVYLYRTPDDGSSSTLLNQMILAETYTSLRQPLNIASGGHGAKTAVDALDNLGALNLGFITDNAHMIASGTNLNNYTTPGAYRCATGTIAGSLLNMTPYKSSGFRLIVSSTSTANGVLQIVIFNSVRNYLYFRIRNDQSAWSEWVQLCHSDNSGLTQLWENGSTTSTFAAQSVSIDGANYDCYLVVPHVSANVDICFTQPTIAYKGKSGHLYGMPNNKIARRKFTVNSAGTSISFEAAEYGGTYGATSTNNEYVIPVYIYGMYLN